jgi:RimJ/RimL family protein N-acetyltransferase
MIGRWLMNTSGINVETVFDDLSEYPKEVTLRSGLKVTLRPMALEDKDQLIQFVSSLPEKERTFLRDDTVNPELEDSQSPYMDTADALTILASNEDGIVGFAKIRRYPFTWNRHMGNVRVTISPAFRNKGLARTLLGELFCKALPTGIEKVITEVVRGQDDTLSALVRLGFKEEALLRNHHLDPKGTKHDVFFMSSDLNHLWDMWRQYCETVSGTWDMED